MPGLIAETNETFQGENATTMGTSVALESVTSLRNATASFVGDQSGNPSAYGVIAAAGKTRQPFHATSLE
jgi:CD320 antigen